LLLTLLWIIFVVDAILLVLVVLLQSGRGGGLSGLLGGGGMAESALGPKTGLPKITGWMAGIFFLSAILIGILTRPRGAMDTTEGGGRKKPGVEAPAKKEGGTDSSAETGGKKGTMGAPTPSGGEPGRAPASGTSSASETKP